MAFLDKLNKVAKNIGDKTGDAIETTKLNAKIKAEKNAAEDDFKKIGEYYYNLFANGGEIAPETAEFCQSAKAHLDAGAQAQAEIERIKAENEKQEEATTVTPVVANAPTGAICPACGTPNNEGTKFCKNCGTKLGVAPAQRLCTQCGAAVEQGVSFCPECGNKMEV